MGDWPHSPVHRLDQAGAYIVTTGTYQKLHHFHSPERLTLLRDALFESAERYGWRLQAWAIMSNHHHFVAVSPERATNLREMVNRIHSRTALAINRLDDARGRTVWHQFWDTHLSYQRSYYARLNYVHHNPVHHRVARTASDYPWCSAGWFERSADRAFFKMVTSFKFDRVNVLDDF